MTSYSRTWHSANPAQSTRNTQHPWHSGRELLSTHREECHSAQVGTRAARDDCVSLGTSWAECHSSLSARVLACALSLVRVRPPRSWCRCRRPSRAAGESPRGARWRRPRTAACTPPANKAKTHQPGGEEEAAVLSTRRYFAPPPSCHVPLFSKNLRPCRGLTTPSAIGTGNAREASLVCLRLSRSQRWPGAQSGTTPAQCVHLELRSGGSCNRPAARRRVSRTQARESATNVNQGDHSCNGQPKNGPLWSH